MNDGHFASGLLLVILGIWLLLQTIAGDLPRRLLSLTGVTPGRANEGGGIPCGPFTLLGCVI